MRRTVPRRQSPGWIKPPVGPGRPLKQALEENVSAITQALGASPDLVVHRFAVGEGGATAAAVVSMDGLVEVRMVHEHILSSLLFQARGLAQQGVPIARSRPLQSLEEAVYALLSGGTLLLLDGCAKGRWLETAGFEARSVEHPDTEVVVRGSREGFTETLHVNLSLLRRRRAGRAAAGAVLTSGLFALLTSMAVVALFGDEASHRLTFPFLVVVRYIQMTEIVERLESLVVMAWVATWFLKTGLFLFLAALGLSHWLGLSDYRALVLPLAALLATVSLVQSRTMPEFTSFFAPDVHFPYAGLFTILLPALLLLLARIQDRVRTRLPDS